MFLYQVVLCLVLTQLNVQKDEDMSVIIHFHSLQKNYLDAPVLTDAGPEAARCFCLYKNLQMIFHSTDLNEARPRADQC
jgi:hypothetical protein